LKNKNIKNLRSQADNLKFGEFSDRLIAVIYNIKCFLFRCRKVANNIFQSILYWLEE
jgi:hypothetical protein